MNTYLILFLSTVFQNSKETGKNNEIVAVLKKTTWRELKISIIAFSFQIFMIRYGSLNIDIGSKVKVIAKPGDIVNIPPMTPYTLRNKVIIFWIFTDFSYSCIKISAELGYDL